MDLVAAIRANKRFMRDYQIENLKMRETPTLYVIRVGKCKSTQVRKVEIEKSLMAMWPASGTDYAISRMQTELMDWAMEGK